MVTGFKPGGVGEVVGWPPRNHLSYFQNFKGTAGAYSIKTQSLAQGDSMARYLAAVYDGVDPYSPEGSSDMLRCPASEGQPYIVPGMIVHYLDNGQCIVEINSLAPSDWSEVTDGQGMGQWI